MYDADGNLIEDDRFRYEWNGENRLVAVEPKTPEPGGKRLTFTYDYLGRRFVKNVFSFEGTHYVPSEKIHFIYDGWNMTKQIKSKKGNAIDRFYVWGLDLSQTLQGAGGVGGLLATSDGSLTHAYVFDASGNVAEVWNSHSQRIAAHYDYNPFGKSNKNFSFSETNNAFRFSTKFSDNESDLIYYGYRFYRGEMGKWMSRDPKCEKGGINLFAFLKNSPYGAVDPLGLDVYAIYRRLYINTLEYTFPLAGHVYLGFNNENMENSKEWKNIVDSHKHLVEDGWITFSFHPDSVRTGSSEHNKVSVIYTESSWVDISNKQSDIYPIVQGETINVMITSSPCEQIAIFNKAIISGDVNRFSPLSNDTGYYSMPTNNCGSWAKSIVKSAGVKWPPEANFFNVGTGLDGPLDYTLLPQLTYLLSVSGYNVAQSTEFGVIEYESYESGETVLIPGITIHF